MVLLTAIVVLVAVAVPALGVSMVRVPTNGKIAQRVHAQKIADLREAARAVCDTFPGNMCEALIKGAHVPLQLGQGSEGMQVRAALRNKMTSGQPFVFASLGSSVTAGHDNHYNSSWPFVLERILKPTFEKLGFGFELRQRAIGGWHEAPYTVGCMHNLAGSGIDAVSWEWWMFGDSKCVVESFLREAYSLNGAGKVPPVVMSVEQTTTNVKLFRTGIDDTLAPKLRAESFNYSDLEHPLPNRRWKPNEWYLTDEFISSAEVGIYEKKLTSAAASLLMTTSRFDQLSTSFVEEFIQATGLKPSHEQQAAIDEVAKAIADKKTPTPYLIRQNAAQEFVESGFGLESFFSTRGIEDVPREWRSWYVAREKAFNINWHPGPLGHLLIASQLAHFFLEQAQLALNEAGRDLPIPVAPPPGKCGAGVPRSCATGMLPHNGRDINGAASGDSWEQAISVDQVNSEFSTDIRMPLRVNRSGNLRLLVNAEQKGDVAVVCMAPCNWWCSLHKGLVGAGPNRFWPPRRDGAPQSKEKPAVSDVDFTLSGRHVSNERLLEMNDKVFGRTGSFCAGCNVSTEVCQAVGELDTETALLDMRVSPRTDPDDQDMFIEILQVMVVPGPNSKPFDTGGDVRRARQTLQAMVVPANSKPSDTGEYVRRARQRL
jgi:hypothetical protein